MTWRRAQILQPSVQGMDLVKAEAWLNLAGLCLLIARRNRHRWDSQAQQPESWSRRSTQ